MRYTAWEEEKKRMKRKKKGKKKALYAWNRSPIPISKCTTLLLSLSLSPKNVTEGIQIMASCTLEGGKHRFGGTCCSIFNVKIRGLDICVCVWHRKCREVGLWMAAQFWQGQQHCYLCEVM